VGLDNGSYSPASPSTANNLVPLVGGITYVRTGVLKWWLGGVLMGGAYMVCGKWPHWISLIATSKGSQSTSD